MIPVNLEEPDAHVDAMRPSKLPVVREDAMRTARFLALAIAIGIAAVVSGQATAADAGLVIVVLIVVAATFVMGPALCERIGTRDRARRDGAKGGVGAGRVAISFERLALARVAVEPGEIFWRIGPNLARDMATILRVRHDLDLANRHHHPHIEALIGANALTLLRCALPADADGPFATADEIDTVATWPTDELSAALDGCVACLETRTARTPAGLEQER